MSTWGVYGIKGRTADNLTVTKDDKAAVRWFVRWRVDGDLKKRTLSSKGHAKTFHEQLMRAKLMGWSCDQRGYPLDPARTEPIPAEAEVATPRTSEPGITFASYCENVWWPIMSPTFSDKNMLGHRRNMRVAAGLLVYPPGDPRCSQATARPGSSILLSDLTADDLRRAVIARRGINARTAAVNERAVAAAMRQGSLDVSTTKTEASPATVRAFFITLSMIVKAAMQSGHTVEDPLSGVGRLAPASKPARVSQRVVPSRDEVFDLADAIATLGPVVDGRPAGDRFRALVLVAGTLAARPGELVAHRPDLIAFGQGEGPTLVTFEETEAAVYDTETSLTGRRVRGLKHREPGETRQVPAIPETADALRAHLERGYDGDNRTFTSPTGRGHLDWANIKAVYWRPACEMVFGGTEKSHLVVMPPKTLRKAAISDWLERGISIYLAADWAGHSTEVAELSYAARTRPDYAGEIDLLTRSTTPRGAAGSHHRTDPDDA